MTNPRPEGKDLARYYHSDAYISHSNKGGNLIDQVYKIARRFTLKWKYNLIQTQTITKAKSILDYGCGTGAFLEQCKKHQMFISGVEPSAVARVQAQKQTSGEVVGDIAQLSTRSFDVITLWHVLEHVSELHGTITQLKTHLKENGTIFIAVPNLQSHDAKNYREHWAGFDVPRHLWHFSRKSMTTFVQLHELKVINVLPMRLDSYYVSLLSEKYKSGKSGFANINKALVQGWKSNREAHATNEYSSLIYVLRK
jgi:2-polyprenyl-3-methyl-5-hydroxy-6-metoxy-1,4-benzoquinol methylase